MGISKQAVNQCEKRQGLVYAKVSNLLQEAELLRQEHPGCEIEMMYYGSF